jgi:hypothetical protein
MLYADHMLQKISSIGRESAILRALDNMPSSLTALFSLFEQDCVRGRTEEQLEALKTLCLWMTYSEQTMTMSEISMLISHRMQSVRGCTRQQKSQAMQGASLLHNENEVIDVEDEVLGRLRR